MPRVITGKYRGSQLQAPKGDLTRPTGDRAKEAIFSQIGSRISDSSFLDLCAGSGQMGIEALSRGATRVVLVEISRSAGKVIECNLDKCRIESLGLKQLQAEGKAGLCCLYMPADRALKMLVKKEFKFDWIYFDPPWPQLAKLWADIETDLGSIMTENSRLIIEAEQEFPVSEAWQIVDLRKHGRTKHLVLARLGLNGTRVNN